MTKTQALAKLYETLIGEKLDPEINTQAEIINALAIFYEES